MQNNTSSQAPFAFSNTNKRYHTWNYHLRQKFGGKLMKIALDAGFSCPNFDGSKGRGGCVFCTSGGRGDSPFGNPENSIAQQIEAGQTAYGRKDTGIAGYIAYFQANTNTYAPLEILRAKFEEALACPNIVGLHIATRPDALPDDVVEYLAQLGKKTFLVVELGLQTIHDATACRIHRGHTYSEFLQGYQKLHKMGIPTGIHIINGLPFESKEEMLATAKEISRLRPYCVKIHMLYVAKKAQLAELYLAGKLPLLSADEYVDIVCDQLELLHPEIVVQRLTGDASKQELLAPLWTTNKIQILNNIDKELKRRNTMQGAKFRAT